MPGKESVPDVLNADRDGVLRNAHLRPTEVVVIDNDEVIIIFKYLKVFPDILFLSTFVLSN